MADCDWRGQGVGTLPPQRGYHSTTSPLTTTPSYPIHDHDEPWMKNMTQVLLLDY
jgi:hypothetical protein